MIYNYVRQTLKSTSYIKIKLFEAYNANIILKYECKLFNQQQCSQRDCTRDPTKIN